jgi:hypothetical protein
VGIKPIHGGVLDMVNKLDKIMVIKKGRKAQCLQAQ